MVRKKSADIERTPVQSEDDDYSFIKELATTVNSTFKENKIMIGDDGGDDTVPYWVRTGIPQLDFAVGGKAHPGFPGARFIEIFGAEASGKSTLALYLTKKAMEQCKAIAYYQDVERVLTPEIIKGTGIDMGKVMREQPDTLEEVFDSQEATLKVIADRFPERAVVITCDSIAACSTEAEVEGEMGDQQMASHAKIMSKGMRKLKKYITDTNVLSIWVNQIREKIGISFGDNTTTFGGKAMQFYASVRIQVTKIKTLKDPKINNGNPYGCTIQATVKKNKVAPPLKKAEYDILFLEDEDGSYPMIDIHGAVLSWLEENDLIEHDSQRVMIEGKKVYRKEARQMLVDNPELFEKYNEMAYSLTSEVSEDE